MFFMYLIRFQDIELFYTDSGFLNHSMALKLFPEVVRPAWALFLSSDVGIYWSYVLFLALLLALALGLVGRALTWLVLLLHVGFVQRNYGVAYGADVFNTFWLLALSFVDHNKYFNASNLWRSAFRRTPMVKVAKHELLESDILSSVGIRLVQLQLCIAYGYTGLEKLKGFGWWEGTAVWYVIGDMNTMMFDLSFLQHAPILVALLTFTTLIFEIYFPVMVWISSIRYWWLLLGIGMHGFIGLFMGLPFFALVMTLAYLPFVDPKYIRQWHNRFDKWILA